MSYTMWSISMTMHVHDLLYTYGISQFDLEFLTLDYSTQKLIKKLS